VPEKTSSGDLTTKKTFQKKGSGCDAQVGIRGGVVTRSRRRSVTQRSEKGAIQKKGGFFFFGGVTLSLQSGKGKKGDCWLER